MNTCTKSRTYILDWGVIDHLAPMILFGSDGFPNDGTKDGQEAVEHIQTCMKCKSWIRDLTSAEDRERMERLTRYCCPQMFVAVEEPKEDGIHLISRHFRDERLWMIDQPDREFGFEFFSFCPWCGNKLPGQPFIDDEKGRG
ncbi:hypothetical protein [Rheinheimera tangshanensis]|uniref:Uncharacterized protein n=1 Tax=Rheinheimera tangshanensis TaxID=400153 RepID=A0A5C8LKD7_9GAMM|nr:hypothetical protein [Rheinheimera tangshanensis]TXK77811.1 hypothetical protein FU839_17955 [Rheinheimera tangshanensis]GGM63732.1 hypothetical protein GCM10010920_25640 [Rheinheimera tangshanensis]